MPDDACIFCKIAKKEVSAKVVFDSSAIIAFEDIKPSAPVDILIIPKAHISGASDIQNRDVQILGELILTAKLLAVQKGVNVSGYRLVLNCGADAGQQISHLHLHLLGGRKFGWPPG